MQATEKVDKFFRFYETVFGIHDDLSCIPIPDFKIGFEKILVVPAGLTLPAISRKVAENMKLKGHIRLINMVKCCRQGGYAIRVRGKREVDDGRLFCKCRREVEKDGIKCTTLTEMLLLELFHFWATGEHLGQRTTTICSGSKLGVMDSIPCVGWKKTENALEVCFYGSLFKGEIFGFREVVTV